MLVVFTASNFFESLNYVFAQEEPLENNGTEIVAENNDGWDDWNEDNNEEPTNNEEPANNDGWDDWNEDNNEEPTNNEEPANNEEPTNNEQPTNNEEPTINTGNNNEEPEVNTGENNEEPEVNTGNNNEEPEINTGNNNEEPEVNTGENNEEPEVNTGNNNEEPEVNTGENNEEPANNTGNNNEEPTLNTDLWEEWRDFNDMVYEWVVRWKAYTIILMDRNLWATAIDSQDEDSYGYFYQWWNNYPFSHHIDENQYTNERVDASGYWPDNRYVWNVFVKWSNDWSNEINNNLWWWEQDDEENDYFDIDANRQWPCPTGYHVPSVWEWYALFSTFLTNNGLDLNSTSGLSYSDYIWKERQAAYYLESEYIEDFKERFNITYAWRIKTNATIDRTWTTAHLWTSTPYNNQSLWFEVWDDHINLWWWETTRGTAYPLRCFKSVEYTLVDYTITYVDGENETTEIKHWWDTLTEPTHTDKWTGYNWKWWYRSGEDEPFNFSTQITWDVRLVATRECAEDYHEEAGQCESNTKTEDCIQTGKVENSTYVVVPETITWDITWGKWNEIPVCEWKCNEDFHLTGWQCESNTKIEDCIQTGKVENSTYVVVPETITWDITWGKWNEIPVCEWKCDEHYHTWDGNNSCEIDTFQFTLIDNEHVDTEWSTTSWKKPYDSVVELNAETYTGYRFNGWQIVWLNWTGVSHTSISSQVVFNMPARDVTATPLTSVEEYEIEYGNIDGATESNPRTYTIETETFSLEEPTKTGYNFVGWTGSNGLIPQKTVTITKWNYGNKKYSAVWQPNSWIIYQVVHAVEKADSTSYEVMETEILSGTTDEMTQAVAKEYTWFTAKTINQKVIKWDGSTVVRVQYQRNIYTITFDSNGWSEVNPITGKYESNLTAPNSPSRWWYTFMWWQPSFPSTMPLWWAELTAQWKKRSWGWSSSSEEETQVTTWENQTTSGENEIITWTVEEIIGEVENLDIDGGTSIAPMLWKSMRLWATMLKALSNPNQQDQQQDEEKQQQEEQGQEEQDQQKAPKRGLETAAELLPWQDFNVVIKTLADGEGQLYDSGDNTSITQIVRWTWEEPTWVITWLLSTEDSESSVYGWYDDGTLYYYTDASTIYLNQDSSYMFNRLTSLESIDMEGWSTDNVTNMRAMFRYCLGLVNLDLSGWNTSNVTNMISLFAYDNNLANLNLGGWSTDSVTGMVSMFYGCSSLTSLDLSEWNTSSVTDMNSMFYGCSKLTSLDLDEWNTSSVTDMNSMFRGCSSLTGLDLNAWDTSNVINMTYMFYGCSVLASVKLDRWNTSRVTNMSYMFNRCPKLTVLNLGNWNTSNVTTMAYMFYQSSTSALTTIYVGSWFVTTKITKAANWNYMFTKNSNLIWWNGTKLWSTVGKAYAVIDTPSTPWYFTDVSSAMFLAWTSFNIAVKKLAAPDTEPTTDTFDRVIEHITRWTWSIPSWVITWLLSAPDSPNPIYWWYDNGTIYYYTEVNNIYLNPNSAYMFSNLTVLLWVDLTNWKTSKVTNMANIFYGCRNLNELDLSSWNSKNVTSMASMFEFCTGLVELNLSGWNTSVTTNMSRMFYSCRSLTGLDLSNWNTAKVTNMSNMFNNCSNLTWLDVSNWNTVKVTNMSNMFYNCNNLQGLDVSGWNTVAVTNMSNMFYNCNNLKELNVGNWNTAKVTNMSQMFYGCSSLKELDVNSWKTSVVTNMSWMFFNCNSLKTIYASTWFVTTKVTNSSYKNNLFTNDINLVWWNGFKYNSSYTNTTYAKINTQTQSWYFTDRSDTVILKFMVWDSEYASQTLSGWTVWTRPAVDPEKEGMEFDKWVDENGDEYDFDAEVYKYTVLYAKFNGDKTVLLPWQEFNVAIKKIAWQMSALFTTVNTTINQIVQWTWNTIPEWVITWVISVPYSDKKVVAWYDSGTIYYYTEADTIYLSQNSSYMFYYMQWLKNVDLERWNTTGVINMGYMFSNCSSLETIYASTWFIVSGVSNSTNMFYSATKLVWWNWFEYDSSYVNLTYARIDNQAQNWYFTDKNNIVVRFMVWDSEYESYTVGLWENVTEPVSSPEKQWAEFQWWVDKNGEEYDFENTRIYKYTKIYAKFASNEAVLLPWSSFNAVIKKLSAPNSNPNTTTSNTTVNQIVQWTWNTIPEWVTTWIISVSYSDNEVIAWYDNWVIYYYTEADNIYLNSDSSYMFSYMKWFTTWLNIKDWNASNVTDMFSMFYNCTWLTELDLSNWDVSNVQNMRSAFMNCSDLVDLNLSGWNAASLINMYQTFYGCSSLTWLDLRGFDTSNVTNMYRLFYNCNRLTEVDISTWNTSNVTDMTQMFYNCSKLETIYASTWFVTSGVTSSNSMFYNNTRLVWWNWMKWGLNTGVVYAKINTQAQSWYFTDKNEITVRFILKGNTYQTNILRWWERVTKPTRDPVMEWLEFEKWMDNSWKEYDFENARIYKYTEIYADFNATGAQLLPWQSFKNTISNLAGWNSNIKKILPWTGAVPEWVYSLVVSVPYSDNVVIAWYDSGTIYYYTEAEVIYLNPDSSSMFQALTNLTELDMTNWDTSNVSNMDHMFYDCNSLIELDLSNWNTSNVTDMGFMFYDCTNLTSLDLTSFDTSNVTYMAYLFWWCSSLTWLDLSNWNTSKVTNMYSMFYDCTGMETLNMSGWDFRNANKMSGLGYELYLRNMTNLKSLNMTNAKFSWNIQYTFYNLTNLEEVILDWADTSNVTYMNDLFYYDKNLKTIKWLNDFDTSSVTNMSHMFGNCSSLTWLDLSNWNTSNVTDMTDIFDDCIWLETLNLSGWDFRNAYSPFNSYDELNVKSLNLTNAQFSWNWNHAFFRWVNLEEIILDGVDTSNVTHMSSMFEDCYSLTSLDLSSFDTSKVTSMSYMFESCTWLETIFVSTWFVTDKVTSSYSMFYNDKKLIWWNGTVYDSSKTDGKYAKIDKPWQKWYFTDKNQIFVQFMMPDGVYDEQIVSYGSKVTRPEDPVYTWVEFEWWITENGEMFDFDTEITRGTKLYGYKRAILLPWQEFNATLKTLAEWSSQSYYSNNTSITQIEYTWDMPEWAVRTWVVSITWSAFPVVAWYLDGVIYLTTEVDSIDLNSDSSYMFYNFWWLESIDTTKWNTSNVTTMNDMFDDCYDLKELDVSKWNTSNVTTMSYMFGSCYDLKELDVSNWDTSNVTAMSYMFNGCNNLKNLDVSSWNTSNVTTMYGLFDNCSSLEELDVSKWDTTNLNDMTVMFFGCSSLEELDLSNWNTSSVYSMWWMFYNCSNLRTIYASTWFVTTWVTSSSSMFYNDINLAWWNGTKFSGSYTDKIYAKIDNQYQSWYFTEKWWDVMIRFMVWTGEYDVQVVPYGSKVTRPTDPVLVGEEFGWWTTVKGELYDFNTDVTKYTELYAVSNKATLLPWQLFNATIKTLTEWSNQYYYSDNTSITQIIFMWNMPEWVERTAVVSLTWWLSYPVMAWYTGWVIYLVTQADVVYMNPDSSYMFYNCNNLTELDLSNLDTSNVTNMSYMFSNCNSLNEINWLNAWDTSNVTDMWWMFNGCSSLTQLDVSSWDTSNVTNMGYMFGNMTNLNTIYASNSFVTSALSGSTSLGNMFVEDVNLVWWNGTVYDSGYVDAEYARIDGQNGLSWYFTDAMDKYNIILEATSTAANQTLKINKYFANAYTVDRWDGTTWNLTADTTHTYASAWTYTITLSTTADRWTFSENSKTLVPMSGTTMTWVKITYMPSLLEWFQSDATSVGSWFFYRFNSEWAITSLPEWSFDTSHITTVWAHFFSSFNNSWKLATLPEWSFDISNITSVGMSFFMGFNMDWSLTSLPAWSFKFSTWLTSAASYFFFHFNDGWKLTSLPTWSFDTSKITSTSAHFFSEFNNNWKLTSLPAWSFNLSKITTAGGYFFYEFNNAWQLTSLPTWSFSFTWITEAGNSFFRGFNSYWKLTSLPAWSFDASNITSAGTQFFAFFNANWAIVSLPDSFKMSSAWASSENGYNYAFSSPSYTLNKNVYDLVDGLSVPTTDRNTFSDNQPWRCWVAANWLVNPGWCSITYNLNWWTHSATNPTSYTVESWTFWLYQPTKTGYMFLWWTWSNGTTANANVYITQWSTWNRTYNAVWWSFEDIDAYFISSTWAVSNITLMDRNMWASNDDISSTGSYWYHYQWWNNYGFSQSLDKTVNPEGFSTGRATYDDYWPTNPYNSPIFRWWNSMEDYWNTSDDHYDNLWWWIGDAQANNWWLDTNNPTDRQWPCPEWYHVPSAWEWWLLVKYYGDIYTTPVALNVSNWLYYFTDTDASSGFRGSFHIPFAGYRNYGTASPYFQGSYGDYWSSSPYEIDSPKLAHNLNLSSSIVYANGYSRRALGQSVRCFSNDYLFTQPSMTINTNWWTGWMVLVEWNTIKSYTAPKKDKYVFKWWYSTPWFITWSEIIIWSTAPANLYAKWEPSKDIILEATVESSDNLLSIYKYFNNAYTINWWDGSPVETASAGNTHTYSGAWTYTITLSLTGWASRWTFTGANYPLIPNDEITMITWLKITYMPSLADWFGDSATNPWNNFFRNFNYYWALTSLPEWSFDTSHITTVGDYFFYRFNKESEALTSLPEWSFDISNITTVGDYFFAEFNDRWSLTSLPNNSFNTSKITTVGEYFFKGFNSEWLLESLPTGSFRFATWLTAINSYGFFSSFNYSWALTSLPDGSFDTSHITTVGDYDFFFSFNAYGSLTSLPEWSFDISNITEAQTARYFFSQFNFHWALTSLPDNSFRFSTLLTGVGADFFSLFNSYGALTSLPEWSFDTSHITTAWSNFFEEFNYNWALTNLPNSFKLNSAANENRWYWGSFNSPNYTINRKVSDLVSWVTVPSSDMNTFSDNQPWRCGVHANWLVTTADACSISYDDGVWWTWEIKYNADTTWVVAWSGISVPTRNGYTFKWWYDASWNRVNEVLFPDMDGQTLYAEWNEVYIITYNLNWWAESRTNPTTYTVESWTFWLYQPTKTWAMFLWWTGSNGNTPNANIYITQWSTWNRTYNAVWWTYENIEVYYLSDTWIVSSITLMDRNMWANTDDISSTWSYWFHYQWWNNQWFSNDGKRYNAPISDYITENSTDVKVKWNSSYDNSHYANPMFVISSDEPYDYWLDSVENSGNHLNLWWGGDDSAANQWWLSTITAENITNRQWPCPAGYHVPSAWELNKVLTYRYNSEKEWNRTMEDLNWEENIEWFSGFMEIFNIPYAGGRDYENGKYLNYTRSLFAALWSSSSYWNSNPYAISLYMEKYDKSIYLVEDEYRANGDSIRCFSDSYISNQPSITIDAAWWTWAMIVVEWSKIKLLWAPKLDANSIFEWWYSTSQFVSGTEVSVWDSLPSALYAKKGCKGWYHLSGNSCVWTFNDIDAYFISDTWSVSYITLVDRNLWASMTWAGTGALTWSHGYKYQRWNNYWFDDSWTCSASENCVMWAVAEWNDSYNNKWYYAPVFYNLEQELSGWYYDYWTWKKHYDGLRWWSGDNEANNRWLSTMTAENITNRQWPCMEWYHVPSVWEWNDLLKNRAHIYTWEGNILNLTTLNGLNSFSDGSAMNIFLNTFNIPFTKTLDLNWSIYNYPFSNLISSSPVDVAGVENFCFNRNTNNVWPCKNSARSTAYPVRCFSNDYMFTQPSMTINTNGWTGWMIIVEWNTIKSLWTPKKDKYVFKWWYSTSEFTAWSEITTWSTVPTNLYAKWEVSKDIILEATSTEANQTLKINKYFNNAYTVDWGDGTPVTGLTADTTHTYFIPWTYTIILSTTANRWTFKWANNPLVPQEGTTMTWVKVTYMPSLADGFGSSATSVGNNFFRAFNYYWAITGLPTWSFDTSNITAVGTYFFRAFNFHWRLTSLPDDSFNISNISWSVWTRFFANFNRGWALISLPEWSFDTSNITKVWNNFFWEFNSQWALTSLPENSFNTSKISSIWNEFFRNFNFSWQLTSLPDDSFNISNISWSAWTRFFYWFNCGWKLTNLPEWSFDTSNITAVWERFFESFNSNWQLTSLPENSFDISNITTVWTYFFSSFNRGWLLESLPNDSFRLSTWLTATKDYFFFAFNHSWAITSLPAWSFDTSNITAVGTIFFTQFNDVWELTSLPIWSFRLSTWLTEVGTYFFHGFNRKWAITSLPEWSFDTSQITSAWDYFFSSFNRSWSLESLPEWSFDISNIMTGWSGFFWYFNSDWEITTLPDSFTINSVWVTQISWYDNAFNSTWYTLNRKVSDLVSWVTVPMDDRDTFSDNQPWRCGVHANWLVTTADACSISYDDGLWWTWEFKYNADTTWVVVWSWMTAPTRSGYTFKWWYTASWERVDEVIFPEMDGQTLYARWELNTYAITYDYNTTNYTIPLNGYIDTKYIIDRWRDFKLNSTINFPTLGNRYLLFGNYDSTNELNLELKNNKLRVYSNGERWGSTATLAANKDIMVDFDYTASDKSFRFTTSGTNSNASVLWTNNKSGTGEVSLRIWTDTRTNSTFTPYTLKSASITDYYDYWTKLTRLPNSPTKPWYTFLGWYTDAVNGTQVTTQTDVPAWDTTYFAHWIDDILPIWWTFTINSGAEYTNNTSVILNTTCATDLGEWTVQVAYGTWANPDNWTACSWVMNFTLPSGDWEKTVYMRFRDGAWNTTDDVIDTIILDTTKPVCSIKQAACTSGTLQLTLTWSEILQTLTWWTKVNDTKYTLNVTNNNAVSVTVSDLAWNTWSCSITPTNYDVSGPNAPVIGCPTTSNVVDCFLDGWFCPQYDFDGDGDVDIYDVNWVADWYCSPDEPNAEAYVKNKDIKADGAITNNPNPKLVWITPEDSWCSEVWWYELQICSDNTCNTVLHSGSYAEVVWHTNLADGIYYWRVKAKDSLWNRWNRSDIWSFSVDATAPEWSLTGTNILNSSSQRLTWTCTDAAWISAYYLGTDSNPTEYTTITTTTNFTTWMDITATWTYYLFCKDIAWNISTWKSISYIDYQVKNMLDTITWNASTYNTTNYGVDTTKSYIISWWTNLTLADLCTSPSISSTLKITSIWNPSESEATNVASTNIENQTYVCWYARNLYNFKMTKNTWIATIYYKINGATSWSSTTATKTVSMKAWSTAYAYAVASNGYTCAATCKSSETPQTYSSVTAAKTYSPTTTVNTYTITYNLDGWVETLANPTTYTVTSWTFWLYQPTKTWAMFLWWTWSNGNDAKANIYITKWSTWNRTYNAVWWSFEDIDAYFISETWSVSYITLMDRNMWASIKWERGNLSTGSYGFKYQWWNNHWFADGCWTNNCSDVVTTFATTTKARWNNAYNNKWYNGNIFIKTTPDYWSNGNVNDGLRWWSGDDVSNLRWWSWMTTENVKNRQWPCPEWYHVPSIWEWNVLLTYWYNIEYNKKLSIENLNSFNEMVNVFGMIFGFAGYRLGTNANITQQYTYWRFWSSSRKGSTVRGLNYQNPQGTSYSLSVATTNTPSYAHSVRCFSNDYMFTSPSMTIHPNGWTGAMILVDGGIIKQLWMPQKRDSNSAFKWWYSTSSFTAWSEVNVLDTAPANIYAKWSCDNGYVQNESGNACVPEKYTITYNLNWWTNNANNPTRYTIESWDITLAEPTKTWYTFAWWTGSNGDIAQTWVVIPAWSYGNKTYNAVWQANTNTPYTVYHYVKPVWSSVYELAETQTWHGTTDEILILSWLAKTWFVCVHYRRWSLTWTEDWPWEIIVQTIIKWDGSTKIYLYYDRDSHIVHLSGDDHVQYLKINGELYDESEAVRECGSEVPVNAVPKPWYHFVRWEERRKTEDEDGED